MNEQDVALYNRMMDALDGSMEKIYGGLGGKPMTVRTLAEALLPLCSDVPIQELEQDCQSLLDGIHSGTQFTQNLLDMPEEELARVFPNRIRNALEQMSPDQQKQYLIIMYQYLSQTVEQPISGEEAIAIANMPTEELFHKVCDLSQYAKAELTNESAEIFHDTIRQVADKPMPAGADQYTDDERMWVLSAALYAQAKANNSEKIPAAIIGEVVGMSSTAASAFKENMLSRVIPAAVGALAVAAVGTLVFLGVKALMECSLFISVMSWMTARVNPTVLGVLCAAYLAEPVGMIAEEIYSAAYTATASFTTRFLRDEAREAYLQNSAVLMPGEHMVNTAPAAEAVVRAPVMTEDEPVGYEGNGYVFEDECEPVTTQEEDYF